MRNIRVLSAAALLAVGVIGCETKTYDNGGDGTDRTTSTRIDSGTITNDRMNSGNPNDRTGRTSGTSSGGTITTDNSGIDRNSAGTGTSTGTGPGTNTGTGTGTGIGTGTGTGTGTSGTGTGTGTGSGVGGASGSGAGGAGGGAGGGR